MTPPTASIVVPVYNRMQDLCGLLEQLRAQTRLDFEAVVVDDGSDDPVSSHVTPESFPFPLRVIRHEGRCGVGKARNTGVTEARSDLIIFVDSDAAIADTRWFEKHLSLRAQAESMAQRAGKPCFVFHSEVRGIHASWAGRVDTYSNWSGSCMTRSQEIRGRHVPMNNASMRREAFEAAGFFDEELELCEDIEWCFRCLERGVGLFYVPGAPIEHHDRNAAKDVWEHYRRIGAYAPLVRRKRRHSPHGWLFPKTRAAAWVLFLPMTVAMTLHVLLQWLRRDPRVLLYAPGLYLANVAEFVGLYAALPPWRGVTPNRED